MAYIEFNHVQKDYKMGEVVIHALNDANFSVEKGELAVILGSSGAGKTTALNILGGMDSATSGEVVVDGTVITGLKGKNLTRYRRDDIGFVFQFYNLVPNLTALENVELALQICKDPLDARTVLEEVGLKERLTNFPAQLSGGEQQRVAIARALASKPAIILADEPTGNLDSATSQDVLSLLKVTSDRFGQTVVMITHNEEIAQMADRIVRIEDGKIKGRNARRKGGEFYA